MRWVFIKSWHTIRGTSRAGRAMTLCGRTAAVGAEERDELPAGRSCEACLRIVARRADTA